MHLLWIRLTVPTRKVIACTVEKLLTQFFSTALKVLSSLYSITLLAINYQNRSAPGWNTIFPVITMLSFSSPPGAKSATLILSACSRGTRFCTKTLKQNDLISQNSLMNNVMLLLKSYVFPEIYKVHKNGCWILRG